MLARSLGTLASLALLALLTSGSAHAQTPPFTSFRRLVSANGWAPVVVDLEARRVTMFRENMYRFPAPGLETRNLLYDVYLGLRAGGQSRWLTDVRLEEAGYEAGTNLVRTVQRVDGLKVTTTYFAPFTLPERAFAVIAEVTAERDISDVAVFSLHNLHVGTGPDHTGQERITWDGRALVERGEGAGAAVVMPLTPADHRTASPANPYPMVVRGELFADALPGGPIDDAVSGLQFDVGARGPMTAGTSAGFALVVGWAPSGDVAALEASIHRWHAGRAPREILEDERADWSRWLREGTRPVTRDAEEMQVNLQSLAILRMGQVAETGAPGGQLVASLPPGQWDVAWLRDGLFAVQALIETGHEEEAQRALEFYLRGPVGEYQAYVGRPYALSVCRYYGNGREESDWNARGPNVELDGFGMYLQAAASLAQSSTTGRAWAIARADVLNDGVADVLVDFRDPATGLVAADSSIWESHWDGGGRQRWVYTSGTAVMGLWSWAEVLDQISPGDPRVERYRARAVEIAGAIGTHLVDPSTGALGASVEQLARSDRAFADAQAALVLGPLTVEASSRAGIATLDLLRSSLFLSSTTRRGYKRNDDGDLYDEREWAVIDLGISRALRDAGRTGEADALLGWITAQGARNFGIVPELFDQTDARYAGEAPMVGFGAGAYLLALMHRSGTEPFDPPAATDAGPAGDAALLAGDAAPPPVDASAPSVRDAEARVDGGAGSSPDAVAVTAPAPSSCATARGSGWTAILLVLTFKRTGAGRRSRRARPPAPRTAPPA